MIPKSITTLEGLYVANDPITFIKTNADGSVNWDETRGVFSVYCNKRRGDKEFKDVFEISVKGERLIKTMASQLYPGKAIDKASCFASMEAGGAIKQDRDGNPVLNKDGGYVHIGLQHDHLQTLELGQDSEKMMRKRYTAYYEGEVAQGTMPPGTDVEAIVNGIFIVQKSKPKNIEFNAAVVAATGWFGHSKVWSGKLNGGKGGWVVGTGNADLGKLSSAQGISLADQAILDAHHASQAATAAGASAATTDASTVLDDTADIPF